MLLLLLGSYWGLGIARVDPTGQYMATCESNHLLIGNTLKPNVYRTLEPTLPFEICSELIWNPDGDTIVIFGNLSEVLFYSFPDMVFQFRMLNSSSNIIWHPDGSRFALQNSSTITVMDGSAPLWSVNANLSTVVVWSPDGLTLAVCKSGILFLFWGNGTIYQVLDLKIKVSSFEWASKRLILVSELEPRSQDVKLRTIDIISGDIIQTTLVPFVDTGLKRTGSLIFLQSVTHYHPVRFYDTLSLPSFPQFLAFSNDYCEWTSQLTWISSDHSIMICSDNSPVVGIMEARERYIPYPVGEGLTSVGLTWRPTSTLLVLSHSVNTGQPSITIFLDVASGLSTTLLDCSALTFSPTGNLFVVICSGTELKVFNISRKGLFALYREWPLDGQLNFAWMNDEYLITLSSPSAAPAITIWDVVRANFTEYAVPDGITLVSSFPGNGKFITATKMGVQVWNYESTSSELTLIRAVLMQESFTTFAVSSRGQVAAASRTLLLIWDGMSEEILHTHNFSEANCSGIHISLSWAFDNSTLACSCDTQILIWRSTPKYNQIFIKNTTVHSVAWRRKFPFQLAHSTPSGVYLWQPPDVIKQKHGALRGMSALNFVVEGEFLDTTGLRPHGNLCVNTGGGPRWWHNPVEWIEAGKTLHNHESYYLGSGFNEIGWVSEGKLLTEYVLSERILISNQICEPGYGSTGSEPGYGSTGSEGCIPCPSNPGLILVGSATMFLAFTAAQSYFALRKQGSTSRSSQLLGLFSLAAQLYVMMFQRISPYTWQNAKGAAKGALSIPTSTQGEFFDFAATHCILAGMSIHRVKRAKLMLMTVTPVLCFMAVKFLLCIVRRPSQKISLVFGVYSWSNLNSTLILAQLQSLICIYNWELRSRTTIYDLLETCSQPAHTVWIVLGVVPGFLYLLIPIYAGIKQQKNPLDFLVAKYKKRGWIIIQHLRNPVTAIILLAEYPQEITRAALASWLTLHFLATVVVNPYGSTLLLLLEAFSAAGGAFLSLLLTKRYEASQAGMYFTYGSVLLVVLLVKWCCSCRRSPLASVNINSVGDVGENELDDPLIIASQRLSLTVDPPP